MFIRLAGLALAGLMLSAVLAMPAQATQFNFIGAVQDLGSLNTPGTLNFGSSGASGNNNPNEVDYIYSFNLNGPAKLTASAAGSGTNFNELHAVLYSSDPSSNPLFTNGDPGIIGGASNTNLIDIGSLSDVVANSAAGGSSVSFTLASLASGSYFLRVFGAPAELVSFFNGTITAAPVGNVPLPAALPLMLTALGGLGLMARRRKANAA
jgi:hypothetical protein